MFGAATWQQRRTVGTLVRHDLRHTYAATTAGAAWAVAAPLLPLGLYLVVFSGGIRLPMGGAPYGLALAAAYVPWVLVSAGVGGATAAIVRNPRLVKRVRFPVEVLPLAPVLAQWVPHAVLLTGVVAAAAIAGYGGPAILAAPYWFLCATLLAVALGRPLAAANAVAQDVGHAVQLLLQVWFWTTPIAWAPSAASGALRWVVRLNPLSYVVGGYRHALLPGAFAAPGAVDAAWFWGMTLAVAVAGGWCFRRLRPVLWSSL
jgi:ABC-type polysaccharide/polyol phosphate export permease